MSLRIGQFVTQCHVPRRYQREADVVDRLARSRLPADLASQLGPSLSQQPAIVRIRQLPLRVIIPVSELNEDSISKAWTQAFSRALFTALAYPTGVGPFEVFRADSLAAFLAGAIRHLLDGTAADQWQYAEFEEILRLGGTPGSLRLLCEWPHETIAILIELAPNGVLDRLLPRFDDLALEQLFVVLAPPGTAEPAPLSIADLLAVSRLVLPHPPDRISALPSRRYALRLFVAARLSGEPARSPRAVFHSLLALALLLNEDVFFRAGPRDLPASQCFPAPVAELIESIRAEMRSRPEKVRATGLDRLLSRMRAELNIPPPSPAPPQVRWISSDWCGLFFLSSTLDRVGWIQEWKRIGHFQTGGISCLVAGLALAIADKFEDQPAVLDAGIAVFSGYADQPDLAHLREVFQEYSREVRLEVLHAALPAEKVDDAAATWSAVFNRLGEHLLGIFAARIRGFRKATRPSIVRNFIARPGRIRVERERVVVVPEPSPFHVALHIAGVDSPVESLSWLGGRRVEFELGDL